MQFKIHQSALKAMLSAVAPAVAKKSTLPVLSNVLIKAGTGIQVSATNLDIGIILDSPADVETPGAITLPADLLLGIVGDMKPEILTFTATMHNQTVVLDCGRDTATIKGIESDEFPALPNATPDAMIEIPAGVIKRVAAGIAPYCATDDSRPVLCGVHMVAQGGNVRFVSADGFQLSRLAIEAPGAIDVLISGRSFGAVAGLSGANAVLAGLDHAGQLMVFAGETWKVFTRTIEGRYPDVDRVFPTKYTTRAIVDVQELRRIMRMAGRLNAAIGLITLHLTPTTDEAPGQIAVSSAGAEIGSARNVIAARVDGDPVVIKLNGALFAGIVGGAGSPMVALEVDSGKIVAPIHVTPVDGDAWRGLLMPMTER